MIKGHMSSSLQVKMAPHEEKAQDFVQGEGLWKAVVLQEEIFRITA